MLNKKSNTFNQEVRLNMRSFPTWYFGPFYGLQKGSRPTGLSEHK